MRHFARVFAFAVVKPEWLNQHVHTRVRVDIPNNVVRDIEYGQNSMSEIKTLAHKMDIGRYGKLGTLGPKIFVACGEQKVVFTIGGFFAIHIRSATPGSGGARRRVGGGGVSARGGTMKYDIRIKST